MLLGVNLSVLGLACLIFIFYLFKFYVLRNRELPPGPLGIPIFGYIPFVVMMRNELHLLLSDLREKYGDIYSMKVGFRQVVVLNSAETLREASHRPEFLGRPKQSDVFVAPVDSPLFGNGTIWLQHKRFALRVLKELETGPAMEGNMKHEIQSFVEHIEKHNGKPVYPRRYVCSSVENNITRLCFGRRYDFDDPEKKFLDDAFEESTKLVSFASVSCFFPWLSGIGIVRKIFQTERLMELYAQFCNFTKERIKEHKSTFDEKAPRDFVDYYLSELSSKGKSQNTTFSENLITDTLLALYLAGNETISTTIEWCLYIMAAYPKVQRKVQKEIDEVVGRDRTPSFSDQKNLPYTRAVLMEIQRWKTTIPGIPRITLEDCKIGGYRIPKETIVFLNSWGVHHDPRYWKNPDDFIPERFLSPDGNSFLTDNKHYAIFGVGKRSCPGENMSVVKVFLFFTIILQKFHLKFPEGHTPDLRGTTKFVMEPKLQKLCFMPRTD